MNSDNFLGDRPSTRVRAPPGGASSISFGWSEPAPAPAAAAAPKPRYDAPVAYEAPAPSKPVAEAAGALQPFHFRARARICCYPFGVLLLFAGALPVSSNRFACGSNQNAGNVITDRPTTRIHAAPGGKTSISLGWE